MVVPVRESAGSASKPLVHNRIPGLGTFTGKAAYSYASYSVAPARSRRWGSVALSGGAELSDVACGLTAVLEDRRRTSTGQRVDSQKSRLARFRTPIERRCVDAVHGESITKLDLRVPGQELLNALLITTTGEGNEDATAIGHSLCSCRFQQISMGDRDSTG